MTDNAGTMSWDYTYDALHRLADAREILPGGPTGRETGFTWDAVGNRVTRSLVLPTLTATETYSYDAVSNRLLSTLATSGGAPVQTRTLAHGDSGNRTAEAADGAVENFDYTIAYDSTDRLVEVRSGNKAVGEYLHNALAQRVAKTADKGKAKPGVRHVLLYYLPRNSLKYIHTASTVP